MSSISRRRLQLTAAEPDEIGEAGMSAHRNAVVAGEANRLPHDAGIARMKSTGDVRRRDAAHHAASAPSCHAPNDSPTSLLRSMEA